MHETPIYMIHDLQHTPQDKLPDGCQFRMLDWNQGDDKTWAKLVTATNEFSNTADAMKRFDQEFRSYPVEASQRILLLETAEGEPIGTACAWYGDWQGQAIGRLHWVEIAPAFQGKKLGKPLIAAAVRLLARFHAKAYLKTQESSLAAIHLYRKLGFYPAITTNDEQDIWNRIETALERKQNQ